MNIPERFEDGTFNPFSIETPYAVEMRRRAARTLLDWATPAGEADTAGDEAPLSIDSFDEWVPQAAIATGRVASALYDCQISGCTDTAHAEMLAVLPIVEHLAAEFRRLVVRAESRMGGEQ